MDQVLPVAAGRSSERPVSFPDALLYRGRTGDGADCLVTFDRRTVVLSRPLAGLSCRIRLTASQYQAMAVETRSGVHVVCLVHAQPGLSVDLAEADDLGAAEEYCEKLADFLNLPAMLLARGEPGEQEEAVVAAPRRNRKARSQRPRFLTRRKTGDVIEFPRIAKREIIARN
jgi:hypothetical protein